MSYSKRELPDFCTTYMRCFSGNITKTTHLQNKTTIFTPKLHYLKISWDMIDYWASKNFSTGEKTFWEAQLFQYHSEVQLSSAAVGIPPPKKMPDYVKNLTVPKQRTAFTLGHLNVLPSTVTSRCNANQLYSERQCSCDSGKIETIDHILLDCFIQESTEISWLCLLKICPLCQPLLG